MSTTAGLGSWGLRRRQRNYALFALILGLFSFLAFFSEMLLIVPLASLVAAVIAFRQINRSSGTQTGRWLIVLGLLAAIGCGGTVLLLSATQGLRTRADRETIAKVTVDFAQKVKNGNTQAAYDLFSDRFHQHRRRKSSKTG